MHRSYRQCGPVRRTQRGQPLAPSPKIVRAVPVPMVLHGEAVSLAFTFNFTTNATNIAYLCLACNTVGTESFEV